MQLRPFRLGVVGAQAIVAVLQVQRFSSGGSQCGSLITSPVKPLKNSAGLRYVAALCLLVVLFPSSALAQCPLPTAATGIGDSVLNPDTGSCFEVKSLVTYQDAKNANPALDITLVADANAVVYLRGTEELVLVKTAVTDYAFLIQGGAIQSQLYQVNTVTTAPGNAGLVTAVSVYVAGEDPADGGTTFTSYAAAFTAVSGTTGGTVARPAPSLPAGRISYAPAGSGGSGGSDGYLFGGGVDGDSGGAGPTVAAIITSPTGSLTADYGSQPLAATYEATLNFDPFAIAGAISTTANWRWWRSIGGCC